MSIRILATIGIRSKGVVLQTIPDISTAVYDGVTFDFTAQGTNPTTIFIKPDATKLFIVFASATNKIYPYTFSVAGDITTLSYDGASFTLDDSPAYGLWIKSDGLKFWFQGGGGDMLDYSMSAWSITSATWGGHSPTPSEISSPTNITFNSDISKLYIASTGDNKIYQYNFTSPGDITTEVYSGHSLDVSAKVSPNNLQGIFISPDGTTLYFCGNASPYKIWQYSLSVPGDLSTATDTGKSFTYSSQLDFVGQFFFVANKLYIADNGSNKIFQYSVSYL